MKNSLFFIRKNIIPIKNTQMIEYSLLLADFDLIPIAICFRIKGLVICFVNLYLHVILPYIRLYDIQS